MDIKKLDRTALKNFFTKNAMPTAGNFSDLIEGTINQKDDGLAKVAGEPLSLQADGDNTSQKKVLNFYTSFADPKGAAWTLCLNPRATPSDPKSAKGGLSFGDADGNSKLFIEQASGNVGIGTLGSANHKLDVMGDIAVRNKHAIRGNDGWLRLNQDGAFASGVHTPYVFAPGSLNVGGAGGWGNPGAGNAWIVGSVGIGTTTPRAKLEVKDGAIMPASGNLATAGIQFPPDPGGGSSDAAWLRHYAREGEGCTLELGISNDGNDHIALMPSGNVGIGTNAPQVKLDVRGIAKVHVDLNTAKDADSKMTYGGNLVLKGNAPQIDFIDTDHNDWSIHVNSHKMYFIREPWNYQDLVLDGGGNVGIGTDGPTSKLDVRGDLKVSGAISCGGRIWMRTWHGTYLGVRPDGSAYGHANKKEWESFTMEMGCSRELKENIHPLSGAEAAATLERLSPVKFDYKGAKLFRQNIGFIAEEMPDNLAGEDRKTLSPFEITPVLTRVAQEQQQRLAALQAMVEELSGKVQRLSAELQAKAN